MLYTINLWWILGLIVSYPFMVGLIRGTHYVPKTPRVVLAFALAAIWPAVLAVIVIDLLYASGEFLGEHL